MQIIFQFHEGNLTCLYLSVLFDVSQCSLFTEETWRDKTVTTCFYTNLVFSS